MEPTVCLFGTVVGLSRRYGCLTGAGPQKGSRKLNAKRILILNFVLPLFFPVFLSVLRS